MEKNIKNSWQEVVLKTKDWHKTFVQFQLTDEVNLPSTGYNPILCEKEWEAIKAIKQWKKDPKFYFSLQDFNESEKHSFEMLTKKSKNVYFKEGEDKPYKKVFYVPFSIWNDDPDAAPDCIPLKDKTIISSYARCLYDALKQRSIKSMEAFFNDVKDDAIYNFEPCSLWLKTNIDKVISEGVNLNDIELSEIDGDFLNKLTKVTKEFQSEWLQSAIIPIIVSAKDYDIISDFEFNYDGLLEEEMNDLKTMRTDFEPPMNLEKSLLRLNAIKFSLWSKSVLYDNFVEGGVKRESVIYFHINNGDIVYMSACVMDIDKNNEEIITLRHGRKISDSFDIQEALLPWIMCADPKMMWTVMYTDDKFEDENFIDNYKINYENTILH